MNPGRELTKLKVWLQHAILSLNIDRWLLATSSRRAKRLNSNVMPYRSTGDPIPEAQGLVVTADGHAIVGTDPQLATIAKAQDLVCSG
ncbi:hypothetical protein AVDCRST_MAG81-4381 [uncultured Synechococcales cyanobacterium]|uniref:Uncharacterized protein n=1 Tax=uncultured Synechococcales cyanobacterium TaxID=1936017 RepID=A0A6J4VYN6_9CYAN|nr:hypothetical protein AVDCRST_MAG81-4381 [uncultured Synechococcales cyanobacterium]